MDESVNPSYPTLNKGHLYFLINFQNLGELVPYHFSRIDDRMRQSRAS